MRLALVGSWRTPFLATAALGFVIAALAVFMLPPLTIHLDQAKTSGPGPSFRELFERPIVLMSFVMTAVTMMSGFMVIPNISSYVQYNLAYPREHLEILYLSGGTVSFFALRLVGRLVDRYGSFKVGTVGSALVLGVMYSGFAMVPPPIPIVAVFVLFMTAMSFRNVAYNTLTSKVPSPAERARFMSLQSAVQHSASAFGAVLSSRMLTETPSHHLVGLPSVIYVSMGLTIILPVLLWVVERSLNQAAIPSKNLQAPTEPVAS